MQLIGGEAMQRAAYRLGLFVVVLGCANRPASGGDAADPKREPSLIVSTKDKETSLGALFDPVEAEDLPGWLKIFNSVVDGRGVLDAVKLKRQAPAIKRLAKGRSGGNGCRITAPIDKIKYAKAIPDLEKAIEGMKAELKAKGRSTKGVVFDRNVFFEEIEKKQP